MQKSYIHFLDKNVRFGFHTYTEQWTEVFISALKG